MNKQAATMSARILGALRTGKLKADGNYSIPALAVIIGTTRAELSDAVNREFGSITEFCTAIGFTGMNLKTCPAS